MPDISISRDIPAPPERVWGLVSDMTRMGEWSPESTRTDQRHPVLATIFGKVTGVTDRAAHNRTNIEQTLEALERAAVA